MKKLILFDVDGTLVDSYPYFAKIMEQLLPQFGIEPTERRMKRAFTMTAKQEVKYFKVPADRTEEWYTTYAAIARKTELQPEAYPEIDAMFEHLLSQPGVKIGIVTSRSRDDANENLQSFWWYQKMAIVVTSSDTKQPKPAGELLEFACEKLGFSANETFYIGDADTDEQAALNADVDFGGALWGTGSKKNFKSEPLLLDSPEDVNRII